MAQEGIRGHRLQDRAPALTIHRGRLLVSQLAFGVMVGVLGVILATPLAAAAMVAVQMLYVEDVLGDSMRTEVR